MNETKLSEQINTETEFLQKQVDNLLENFEEKTGLRVSDIVVCREMITNRFLGTRIIIKL